MLQIECRMEVRQRCEDDGDIAVGQAGVVVEDVAHAGQRPVGLFERTWGSEGLAFH